jgi:hypothetical protein
MNRTKSSRRLTCVPAVTDSTPGERASVPVVPVTINLESLEVRLLTMLAEMHGNTMQDFVARVIRLQLESEMKVYIPAAEAELDRRRKARTRGIKQA